MLVTNQSTNRLLIKEIPRLINDHHLSIRLWPLRSDDHSGILIGADGLDVGV